MSRRSQSVGERRSSGGESGDPLWYKQAIVYELHVRTFCDSDGDGIGDFAGLTAKLDYLHDLGITALWLLPFYPSPLRDDGYDIADYTNIHPDCGTLHDFKIFLREAHRRGLRVITELVLNHTSSDHSWFQRARRAPPGSRQRDFYVWSDTPNRYRDARIIFNEFESSNWSWDPVAGAYYWHRFYSHQPDLNYRNPAVIQAIARVLDFWLRLGVDGLRLDAVPQSRTCSKPRARYPRTSPRLTPFSNDCVVTSKNASPTACCSRRRTSGRKTRRSTSEKATSVTWPSTFP